MEQKYFTTNIYPVEDGGKVIVQEKEDVAEVVDFGEFKDEREALLAMKEEGLDLVNQGYEMVNYANRRLDNKQDKLF